MAHGGFAMREDDFPALAGAAAHAAAREPSAPAPAAACRAPAAAPATSAGVRRRSASRAAAPLRLRPRLCQADGSLGGLPETQEDEVTSIRAIYEGAVEELPLRGASDSTAEDELSGSSEGEAEEHAAPRPAPRPSTPVRRYRVNLSASLGQEGCGRSPLPTGHPLRAQPCSGPTAQLEVQYGRLYPLETPALLLQKVDGLPQAAVEQMHRLVREELQQSAGRECVFQICNAIIEFLRQHDDPLAEVALHDRMQQRVAEEEEQARRRAAEAEEQARRRAAEAWERQKQLERDRNARYQRIREAAERVGDAGRRGTLEFGPEGGLGAAAPGPPVASAGSARRHPASPELRPLCAPDLRQPPAALPGRGALDVGRRSARGGGRREEEDDEASVLLSRRFHDLAPGRGGGSDGPVEFSLREGSSGGIVFEADSESQPQAQAHAAAACAARGKPRATADKAASPGPGRRQQDRAAAERAAAAVGAAPGAGRYAVDFEELGFLGRGGFGSVTKVRHRVDRQLYAIKRIELTGSQGSREQILKECATLPRLTHLHIVRYYQAWKEVEVEGSEAQAPSHPTAKNAGASTKMRRVKSLASTPHPQDGDDWLSMAGCTPHCSKSPSPGQARSPSREFLYIQMEFCDGTTLREAIDRGVLHQDEAAIWKLFRQVLDALAYVHSKKLIHRDLKPANVFLSSEGGGHVKLGDFGLTTEAQQAPDAQPGPGAGGRAGGRKELRGPVGTALYMAPEVRRCGTAAPPRGEAGGALPYDGRADMFSLGVILFEMWSPPFTTGMERAERLGRLADGLRQGQLLGDLHLLPRGAPREVAEILDSLLAQDPTRRMTAEHLLNESGLLPAGAFDPLVQRLLKAVANPSSTESVALLQALFSRSEDTARDVSYFDQLFRSGFGAPARSESEARDAAMALLRDHCWKHSLVYEQCPLLTPVHSSREAAEDGRAHGRATAQACHLLDAGNTLLELRTNLTEPLTRLAAARVAAAQQRPGAGLGVRLRTLRQYHVGTVYREALTPESSGAGLFGHPREITSAALQLLWWPPAGGPDDGDSGSSSPSASPPASPTRRASGASRQARPGGDDSLAQEAELLHLLGGFLAAAGLAERAELRLSDARLAPLLKERSRRAARRAREAGSGGGSAEDGDGQPAGQVLAELALQPGGAGGQVRRLRRMLQRLKSLLDCLEGVFDAVTLEAATPKSAGPEYGPGLAFRVLLRRPGEDRRPGQGDVVCAGGRVDQLLARFASVHGASGLGDASESAGGPCPAELGGPVCFGVSTELAMDKVAAALVQEAASRAAAHAAGMAASRRGARPCAGAVPAAPAWWRQCPNSWCLALVGTGAQEVGSQHRTALTGEILKVAGGLWRLGVRCEVHLPGAGALDLRAVQEAHRLSSAQAPFGATPPPDFVLTVQRAAEAAEAPAAAEHQGLGTKAWAGSRRPTAAPAGDRTHYAYCARALSEQGQELVEWATKKAAPLDFEEPCRLFEFFEKLRRQLVARQAR